MRTGSQVPQVPSDLLALLEDLLPSSLEVSPRSKSLLNGSRGRTPEG